MAHKKAGTLIFSCSTFTYLDPDPIQINPVLILLFGRARHSGERMRGITLVLGLALAWAFIAYVYVPSSSASTDDGRSWEYCPRGSSSCISTTSREVALVGGVDALRLPEGTFARVYDSWGNDQLTFSSGAHKCVSDLCGRHVRVRFFGGDVRWIPLERPVLRLCDSELQRCRKLPAGSISPLDMEHMYYIQTLLPDYMVVLLPEDPLQPIRPCWSGGACVIHEPHRTREALLVRNTQLLDTIKSLGMFESGRNGRELAAGEPFSMAIPADMLRPSAFFPEDVTLMACIGPHEMGTFAQEIAPHWSVAPLSVVVHVPKHESGIHAMKNHGAFAVRHFTWSLSF